MNRNTMVSMKKQLNVTDLSGEKVMVDFETGKYFLVKGVGNDIWDMLNEKISVGDIVTKLLAEYEVTEEECEKSVYEFLEQLKKADIIQCSE